MRTILYTLVLIGSCLSNCQAQYYVRKPKEIYPEKYTPLSMSFHYAAQWPAGDMAKRFGFNMSAGISLDYIKIPSGWMFGIDGYYLYGRDVREDVLAKLRTSDGNILSDIGTYASVDLRQRGFYAGATVGKIFKLHDNGNRFGGIRLSMGTGFFQHKIRIQDNQLNAPMLGGFYGYGYDRLSSGVALTSFLGYHIISRDRTINAFAGFETMEALTKNRRGFNFDTQQRDDKIRLDILYGIRFGFAVTLFTNQKAEEIEY